MDGLFFGVSMKCVCVAVFDSAVQAFNRPFYAPSIGAAVRSFMDEVKRVADDNQLSRHPEDFHLTYLADFDEESGVFVAAEGGMRVLIRGKDVSHE